MAATVPQGGRDGGAAHATYLALTVARFCVWVYLNVIHYKEILYMNSEIMYSVKEILTILHFLDLYRHKIGLDPPAKMSYSFLLFIYSFILFIEGKGMRIVTWTSVRCCSLLKLRLLILVSRAEACLY